MNTNIVSKPGLLLQASITPLIVAVAMLWATSASTRAQIFETNIGNGTIGKYTTAGATINAALITGLSVPLGVAVSGTDLFVTNNGSGTIGKYTTAGTTVNALLVTGLSGATGVVVSGADLHLFFGETLPPAFSVTSL
jgi:hypothetical protein